MCETRVILTLTFLARSKAEAHYPETGAAGSEVATFVGNDKEKVCWESWLLSDWPPCGRIPQRHALFVLQICLGIW